MKLQERAARLLGLDAATKTEVSGSVRYMIDGIDPKVLRWPPPRRCAATNQDFPRNALLGCRTLVAFCRKLLSRQRQLSG